MEHKKDKRIFHGPVTIGGIGWHLAEWQRKKGFSSDCIVYSDQGFRQLYHLQVFSSDHGRIKRLLLMFNLFFFGLLRYNIFHFYSARTLLPFNLDLPILRLFRKNIVMTYCGSDIRLMGLIYRDNPYARLLSDTRNNENRDRIKKLMMWWQRLWVQKFTAGRNLYDHAIAVIPEKKVEKDVWLNNIGFDTQKCPDPNDLICNDIPVLIHAPSNKGIKGSEYVDEAIKILKKRGCKFEYQELHGVPNDIVQEKIKNCDVVIDQFLIGGIGTLAFEGMGYGKPVVAYLPQEIINRHMPDCPVFVATVENLADRLEELLLNPELRLDLGRQGIRFVCKHLDYEKIQNQVLELYEEILAE